MSNVNISVRIKLCCRTGIGLFDGLVAFEGADVVTATGHLVGVDGGLGGEPGDEAAGGVDATAAVDAFLDESGVLTGVVVEGGDAPVALGVGGLLLHGEDATVGIDLGHTGLVEPCLVVLEIAHHAGGVLLLGKADEVAQAEVEEVVTGHDEEVIV